MTKDELDFNDRVTLLASSIPNKYRSAIRAANTRAEALAVAERIRDETLTALAEIRLSLRPRGPFTR